MKKIALSADGPISIYSVPNIVSENLNKYIDEFLKWLYSKENHHGYWQKREDGYSVVVYDETAFIKWLNTKDICSVKQCIFIQKIGFDDIKKVDIPYYNF